MLARSARPAAGRRAGPAGRGRSPARRAGRATIRAGRLVVALKHRRCEQKALTQAWSSLKALNLTPDRAREETTLMETVLTDLRPTGGGTDLKPPRPGPPGRGREVARAVGKTPRGGRARPRRPAGPLDRPAPPLVPARRAPGRSRYPPRPPVVGRPRRQVRWPRPGYHRVGESMLAGWLRPRRSPPGGARHPVVVSRGGSVTAAAAVGAVVALGVAAGGHDRAGRGPRSSRLPPTWVPRPPRSVPPARSAIDAAGGPRVAGFSHTKHIRTRRMTVSATMTNGRPRGCSSSWIGWTE